MVLLLNSLKFGMMDIKMFTLVAVAVVIVIEIVVVMKEVVV